MPKHVELACLGWAEASGLRQTELSLSREDCRIVDEFRSKGLHRAREFNRQHILAALERKVPEPVICLENSKPLPREPRHPLLAKPGGKRRLTEVTERRTKVGFVCRMSRRAYSGVLKVHLFLDNPNTDLLRACCVSGRTPDPRAFGLASARTPQWARLLRGAAQIERSRAARVQPTDRRRCEDARINDRALVAGGALSCLLALLLSGCVYFSKHTPPGACSDDLGSPIRNFCVVTPGVLWRGEAPTRSDAQWLVDHGVGTVVSLELDVRHSFESVSLDPNLVRSVTYFRVREFSAIQVLTHYHLDEHVALVLAIIKGAPKPVLVSCRAGVDRTGIIAAAYRVLIQGMSRERAIAEMEGFHSPWDPFNARYVRSLSGDRKARILRNMRKWELRLRPSGRFECAHGRCLISQVATSWPGAGPEPKRRVQHPEP